MRLAIAARAAQIGLRCTGIAFLVYMAFVLWPLRTAIQESQKTLHDSGELVRTVKPLVVPTSQNVNAILVQAGIATGQMAQASIEQRTYWQQLSMHSIDAIGDAQDAIKDWGSLGRSFEAQIAPTFSRFHSTLDSTNMLLGTANDQVVKVGPFLMAATGFVGHADALVADSNLRGSLVNLNRFSGSAALFMGDTQRKFHGWYFPARQNWFKQGLLYVPVAERIAEFGFYTGVFK